MSFVSSFLATVSSQKAADMRHSLSNVHHGLDFYQALNDCAMHNILQAQQPLSPGDKPGPRLVPKIEMSQEVLPLPLITGIHTQPSYRSEPDPHNPGHIIYTSTIDSTQELLDSQQSNTVTDFLLRIREGLLTTWKKIYQAMED